MFRKTTPQDARSGKSGKDVNRIVANTRITEGVMVRSYARETDEELRQRTNRTYHRIRHSLPIEATARYGYEEKPADRLAQELALLRHRCA